MQIYCGQRLVSGLRGPRTRAAAATSTVIAGIRWAVDNGADVINMSLGGTEPGDPRIATRSATRSNTASFVSLSAGNEAEDGNPTIYPA